MAGVAAAGPGDAAASAATLARLGGATFPAALRQGAIAFAAVVSLAAAVTAALAAVRP